MNTAYDPYIGDHITSKHASVSVSDATQLEEDAHADLCKQQWKNNEKRSLAGR